MQYVLYYKYLTSESRKDMLWILYNSPPYKRCDQVKTVFLFSVYSNYAKHNNGLDGDVVSWLGWGSAGLQM